MAKISRKDFLKGAAATAAGVAAMGMLGSVAMAAEGEPPAEGGEGGATEGGEGGGAPAGMTMQRDPAGGVIGTCTGRDGNPVTYGYKYDDSWRTAPDPITDDQIDREYTYDFVVIGAGHAGTNCARALAEAGRSVCLVEKQDEDLYYTLGCDIGHINSAFLKSHGVPEVDPVEFFNDWMLKTQNIANPDLIMQFAKRSGEAVDAFINVFNEEQKSRFVVSHWGGAEYPNFPHEVSGQKFWFGAAMLRTGWQGDYSGDDLFLFTDAYRVQFEYIRSKGGVIDFAMPAQQLIKNEDGRITGVICDDEYGKYVKYNANIAVAICAGDFSQDGDMCAELLPQLVDLMDEGNTMGNFGARNGEGIKMAYWAGARLEPRPIATLGGDYATPSFQGNFGNLWLDEDCLRYCNEYFGDPTWAGKQDMRRKKGTRYTVWDHNAFELLSYGIPAHSATYYNQEGLEERVQTTVNEAVAAGAEGYNGTYAADDWGTLADYLGLEGQMKENFVYSCERYNAQAEAGYDDDYGKDAHVMVPMTPPYLAKKTSVRNSVMMMVTNGGLLTNKHQQVLDFSWEPIPGLFCSGNTCGRRFGTWYFTPVTGVSVGMAVSMGYVLGDYLSTLEA